MTDTQEAGLRMRERTARSGAGRALRGENLGARGRRSARRRRPRRQAFICSGPIAGGPVRFRSPARRQHREARPEAPLANDLVLDAGRRGLHPARKRAACEVHNAAEAMRCCGT